MPVAAVDLLTQAECVCRAASGKDWARLSVGEGEEAELGLGRVFEAKAGRLQGSRKVRAAEVRGVVEREHPGQGSCPQVKVEGRRLGRIPEQTDGHSRGSPPVGVRVEAPTARGRNKQNEGAAPGTLAGHSPVRNGSYPQATTANQ